MRDEHTISNQIRRIEDAISDYKKEQREIDAKIEKLKKAYKTLSAQKKSLGEVKKADKKIIQDKYMWKGNTYNGKSKSFSSKGEHLTTEVDTYNKNIDEVHDDINREITRLKSKKSVIIKAVTGQNDLLSSLYTELRNLTN